MQQELQAPESTQDGTTGHTYRATEGEEEFKKHVLGEGRVPGHQVDKALQGPPAALNELPVGWSRESTGSPHSQQSPDPEQASKQLIRG